MVHGARLWIKARQVLATSSDRDSEAHLSRMAKWLVQMHSSQREGRGISLTGIARDLDISLGSAERTAITIWSRDECV
jgi:hypothetical protein